jgi:antitoxin ParD1/3/4
MNEVGMPIRTSLNVSLTPELERFIQSRVVSGRYQTASEVVREGLRLLEEREQAREVAIEELRAKIRRGTKEADRGELIAGEAVFEEIRQLSTRRRAEDVK